MTAAYFKLPKQGYSLHQHEFFATIKNCDYLAGTIREEHISFEIASVNGQTQILCLGAKNLAELCRGTDLFFINRTVQIYLPTKMLIEHERDHEVAYLTELTLTGDTLLIRTFQN